MAAVPTEQQVRAKKDTGEEVLWDYCGHLYRGLVIGETGDLALRFKARGRKAAQVEGRESAKELDECDFELEASDFILT